MRTYSSVPIAMFAFPYGDGCRVYWPESVSFSLGSDAASSSSSLRTASTNIFPYFWPSAFKKKRLLADKALYYLI